MQAEEYKKIISFAVGNEIEAYDFYKGVSEKVESNSLKAIFKDLANEEQNHKNLLEGFLTNLKPMRFDVKKDYKLSESVEKPRLSIEMKPSDAIALAMKNEEEAMNMYTELANCSSDSEQKEVFQALAKMEKGHKVKLEDTFTGMAFPEAW